MNAATDSAPRAQRRLAPEVRRRQIVLEAARLISAAGFNAVSLADIADACGIRKPSVLHHFPSMADLLAAVLAYRDELSYPAQHEAEDFADPAAANEVFRSTVEHNQQQRELVRLYSVLRAEALDVAHPAHGYFREREQRALDGFARALAWKPKPVLAARELYSFWTGLETLWVADPTVDMLEVWDAFAARFFTIS
jgi:AcrR family transcriptional regulator